MPLVDSLWTNLISDGAGTGQTGPDRAGKQPAQSRECGPSHLTFASWFGFLPFSSLQFHKRQEKDFLDQKKEKEETLLLEMVSGSTPLLCWTSPIPLTSYDHLTSQEHLERQQNDQKMNSKKHADRKRELTPRFPSSLLNERLYKQTRRKRVCPKLCVFDRKRQ